MKNKTRLQAYTNSLRRYSLLLLYLLSAHIANAQTMHAASLTEKTFSGSNVIQDNNLNCANISYVNSTPHEGYLGVISWDQGPGVGTPALYGGFVVFDDLGNFVVVGGGASAYPSTNTGYDVVIGNGVDAAGSHNADYRVGLTYADNTGKIWVDIFDVTAYGTSGLACTYVSHNAVTSTGGYEHPRIDLIEEIGVTSTNSSYGSKSTPGSYPNCSKFVVTYADAGGGDIHGYRNDLNIWSGSPATTVFHSASYVGIQPDVAAGQMINCGHTTGSDFARFTWINSNTGELWYAEWDIGGTACAGAASANRKLTTGGSDNYYEPRIDAIDAYNTGSSTLYDIVANFADYGNTLYDVHEYNPTNGSVNSVNTLWGYSNNYSACVANGPGSQFLTSFYTEVNGGNVVVDAVDNSTGALDASDCYAVNGHTSVLGGIAGRGALFPGGIGINPLEPNAISSSCNDQSLALVAYQYNLAVLYYKFTNSSISFKPAPTIAIPLTANCIYPNPATNQLNIRAADKGAYIITDVMGKEIMKGSLQKGNNQLDISNMAKGIYCISSYDEFDNATGKEKLVKD